MSKNLTKKIAKKQNRCLQILKNESNIKFSEQPTNIILICNAGLSTGLRQEEILNEILKFSIQIKDICLIPQKSYCFMVLYNIEDAVKLFNEMHGKSKLAQNNGVIYLGYVTNTPEISNPWDEPLPSGLVLIEDFISEIEEEEILKSINFNENSENNLKHRQVKHFGYEFIYGSNTVDSNKPLDEKIPESFNFLWNKLNTIKPKLTWHIPDQITVNKYEPGQGIPPHVDTHSQFLDPIISISLLGNTVMEFKNEKNNHSYVLLKQRSLLIMSGESRLGWTHGITPRMTDVISFNRDCNNEIKKGLTISKRNTRISLTCRKLKLDECNCKFTEYCDSYKKKLKSNEINCKNNPAILELENVHKVYNEIGEHFSETRHSPWPKVEEFINSFDYGAILVDIGCGNGKYLNLNEKIYKIGCDRSENLLKICNERNFNAFLSDCLKVPIKSQSVDGCICIAVIHHLATYERRLQAVKEMSRILISGGRGLIYVWAKNQRANNKSSAYLRQNKKSSLDDASTNTVIHEDTSLPIHTNRTVFQHQDVLVPWKLKVKNENINSKLFLRYYHVFEENELENLCKQIESIKIIESYYDQGNWCVIMEKL